MMSPDAPTPDDDDDLEYHQNLEMERSFRLALTRILLTKTLEAWSLRLEEPASEIQRWIYTEGAPLTRSLSWPPRNATLAKIFQEAALSSDPEVSGALKTLQDMRVVDAYGGFLAIVRGTLRLVPSKSDRIEDLALTPSIEQLVMELRRLPTDTRRALIEKFTKEAADARSSP